MTLLFLATLAAMAVAFVLYPVFAGDAGSFFNRSELARQIQALGEQKARLYELLKDLAFEKDEGKISAEDYEKAHNDYMGQVASVMTRIDELTPSKKKRASTGKSRGRGKGREQEQAEEVASCEACGEDNPLGAKFCMGCGKSPEPTRTCGNCGAELSSRARFCNDCGTAVGA